MELSREAYWRKYPKTSPIKLRWRAVCARHCFHIQPGEAILELGAGSGLWTAHLASVTRGENPITAVVFNEEFLDAVAELELPQTNFVRVESLDELPAESFDYIVGTAILSHDQYTQNLSALYRLLKPGGQLLFFEANYWNPQVFLKNSIQSLGRWTGQAPCQVGMRKYQLMKRASHQGFTHIEVIPYDILHPRTPRWLIRSVQSVAFVLEQAPLLREICGTLYIWLVKPGGKRRAAVNLAEHEQLFGAVSVVIPCHNEEMNVPKIVDGLIAAYDQYIHEIIIVNDNSRDRTSEVTRELMQREPRVKLLDRRPPNGVGRALRDGYERATGRYILSMDCDFLLILPELRDLFDAVAAGRDGAIGSRFSYDSVLINYPFLKIVCNRGFHLLLNFMLPTKARDISNNLKLYRAEILKELAIEEPHFAANMETGLKPLLAGYDIEEVPISWIDRTVEMGSSSFNVVRVAPNYFGALMRTIWKVWSGRRQFRRPLGSATPAKAIEGDELGENRSVPKSY
ncbi:MAG TPA: bifunctional class I SAM-dependent methyltransferase/glycosyltransferase family 2 protein [Pyrinomonadaceae bacterium]